MYCNGIVIYKGIEKREGGTFKNDKGQNVDYNSAYVVKFDEVIEGKINERKLKFPTSNKVLYDKFAKYEPYTKVVITCDVSLMQSACKLTPIDVNDVSNEEDSEEN